MHYTKQDILELNQVTRLKLINASSGIKPANLIGTINNNGLTNLAIFNSVMHLGSSPALLGFILRPNKEVPRHTFNNIRQNKTYTINHVHPNFIQKAHYTSAKFNPDISEFDGCGLTEEYINNFKAPFVKESNFKLGMKFREAIEISINNTILVIGEVEHIITPDNAFEENEINLETTNSVGISGLNTYYSLEKIKCYPYARVQELPEFLT